jgi:hypothetical protein
VTRLSGDEVRDGHVWNGFDDALQVWVVKGVVQPCGHPLAMSWHTPCCAASKRRMTGRPAAPGAMGCATVHPPVRPNARR